MSGSCKHSKGSVGLSARETDSQGWLVRKDVPWAFSYANWNNLNLQLFLGTKLETGNLLYFLHPLLRNVKLNDIVSAHSACEWEDILSNSNGSQSGVAIGDWMVVCYSEAKRIPVFRTETPGYVPYYYSSSYNYIISDHFSDRPTHDGFLCTI